MIARAAAADTLVLVRRGERDKPRLHADRLRVGEVTVGREESRVTSLERELLSTLGLEHGEVGRLDDSVSGDRVLEGGVGKLEKDAIALAEAVDAREVGAVGRPMAGDIDELALTGHRSAEIPAGATLQRVGVGAVDDDHVEVESRHPEPCDRIASLRRASPRLRVPLEPAAALRRRDSDAQRSRPNAVERSLEILVELALLEPVEHTRERILPLPNGNRPREHADAGDDHERSEDADEAPHLLPLTLFTLLV
jgi:hypothetical protein